MEDQSMFLHTQKKKQKKKKKKWIFTPSVINSLSSSAKGKMLAMNNFTIDYSYFLITLPQED